MISSVEHKHWPPRLKWIYEGCRCQMALEAATPIQQPQRLQVTEWPGKKGSGELRLLGDKGLTAIAQPDTKPGPSWFNVWKY